MLDFQHIGSPHMAAGRACPPNRGMPFFPIYGKYTRPTNA